MILHSSQYCIVYLLTDVSIIIRNIVISRQKKKKKIVISDNHYGEIKMFGTLNIFYSKLIEDFTKKTQKNGMIFLDKNTILFFNC